MLLSKALQVWLGDTGIHLLAVMVNTLVNALLACWIAGIQMTQKILPVFITIIPSGIGSLYFTLIYTHSINN